MDNQEAKAMLADNSQADGVLFPFTDSHQKALDDLIEITDTCLELHTTYSERAKAYELEYHNSSAENEAGCFLEWMLHLWEFRYFQWKIFWFDDQFLENSLRQHRQSWPYMTGEDFEELTRALLFLIEEKDYRPTSRTGDDGIDLECVEKLYFVGTEAVSRTAVQCKLWHGTVGSPIIREFVGARGMYTKGYFITTGIITQPAREWAQRQSLHHSYNGLYLIDSSILKSLLVKAEAIHDSYTDLLEQDDVDTDDVVELIPVQQAEAIKVFNRSLINEPKHQEIEIQLPLSFKQE